MNTQVLTEKYVAAIKKIKIAAIQQFQNMH